MFCTLFYQKCFHHFRCTINSPTFLKDRRAVNRLAANSLTRLEQAFMLYQWKTPCNQSFVPQHHNSYVSIQTSKDCAAINIASSLVPSIWNLLLSSNMQLEDTKQFMDTTLKFLLHKDELCMRSLNPAHLTPSGLLCSVHPDPDPCNLIPECHFPNLKKANLYDWRDEQQKAVSPFTCQPSKLQ